MKYHSNEPRSTINTDRNIFEDVPSYQNKRVQRKISILETKLQSQYSKHIQAENIRLNLMKKLNLL